MTLVDERDREIYEKSNSVGMRDRMDVLGAIPDHQS